MANRACSLGFFFNSLDTEQCQSLMGACLKNSLANGSAIGANSGLIQQAMNQWSVELDFNRLLRFLTERVYSSVWTIGWTRLFEKNLHWNPLKKALFNREMPLEECQSAIRKISTPFWKISCFKNRQLQFATFKLGNFNSHHHAQYWANLWSTSWSPSLCLGSQCRLGTANLGLPSVLMNSGGGKSDSYEFHEFYWTNLTFNDQIHRQAVRQLWTRKDSTCLKLTSNHPSVIAWQNRPVEF